MRTPKPYSLGCGWEPFRLRNLHHIKCGCNTLKWHKSRDYPLKRWQDMEVEQICNSSSINSAGSTSFLCFYSIKEQNFPWASNAAVARNPTQSVPLVLGLVHNCPRAVKGVEPPNSGPRSQTVPQNPLSKGARCTARLVQLSLRWLCFLSNSFAGFVDKHAYLYCTRHYWGSTRWNLSLAKTPFELLKNCLWEEQI